MNALLLALLLQSPDPPVPDGMVLVEGECVHHSEGVPVPGVHLTMRDPTAGCRSPETQTTVSDADGKFRFAPFPPGRRWVVTRSPADGESKKPLYPPTELDLEPEAPGRFHFRVVLGETGSVRGRVVDADTGTPVRGGQVVLRTENRTLPIHPVTGEFRVPDLALRNRSQQVYFEVPGYAQTWGVLQMGESSIEGMTIRMRRSRTVTGTVVDEEGRPVTDAYVDLQGQGQTPYLAADGSPEIRVDSPGRVDVRGASTDGSGRYRIDGLDPEFTWSTTLKAKGTLKPRPFRKESNASFTFGPREFVKTVSLVEVEGVAISGKVRDAAGEAIGGGGLLVCPVSVVNEVTRERPLFVAEPGPEGTPPTLRWAEDAGDRVAFLPDLLQGSVRFREAHLRPIAEDGTFAFDAVEPGTHVVILRRKDNDIRTFLRVVGKEPLEWNFVLPAKSEIVVSGRVRDAAGAAVAGATVKAYGAAEEEGEVGWSLGETTTTSEGTYSLLFERGGPWRVVARDGAKSGVSPAQGGSNASVDLTVR